jgi:hypothetical protein
MTVSYLTQHTLLLDKNNPFLEENNFILISNFRRVLNAVCFLLGNSPASELYT